MALLGIDVGTSGCKASIVDCEGNVLGSAYKEYPIISPFQGWNELDPEQVWSCVKTVISAALAQNSSKNSSKSSSKSDNKSIDKSSGERITAISASSFGEAAVPIDKNGKVLHNSILYIDSRGTEEAEHLQDCLGNNKILHIAGTTVHPMYTINKIMWLKKHRPEVYASTWKFLLFADFILFRLGADPHTDYSLAARTMAFDVVKKQWSPEILDGADVDIDKFGKAVQAGTIVGEVSHKVAEELGLPKGILLVSGGHDQPCAALGAGVIKAGMAVDGLGTTECITPAFNHPIISQIMADASFACVPHVIKDMYVTYAFTFTSGSMLKWYRDNFGKEYLLEADRNQVNVYDLMIMKAEEGSGEIFVLPHFAGAATPYMDVDSKGAIIGLNIGTKPQDILRGILEGITFEIMVNEERLAEAGVVIDTIRAVGGLSKSDKYLQLKADMMGKKVSTLNVSEAGTLGAVILAGTASGVYKSIPEAVEILVKERKSFYPDRKRHEYFLERFDIYKRIYPAVKSIYKINSKKHF